MVAIGFYGDDFTGSVDVLLQFRRAGIPGVLVTRPDAALPDGDLPVVGIAGIARSLPTERIEAELTPAFTRLRDLDPRLVQYKVCSTADSSSRIGSIGRAVEIGRSVWGEAPVLAAFAQPDFGRYTAFGHHFARDGAEVYRLDRQPTMRAHPVTPATESDLRRHLGAQTDLPIGGLAWTELGDADAVARALRGDEGVVVADALTDEHLDVLATALLADPHQRFVVGAGGISAALGRALSGVARLGPLPERAEPAAGPVLVLSGSASARTSDQIAASGWPVVDAFADDAIDRATSLLEAGADLVVSSTVDPARTARSADVEERLAAIGEACLQRVAIGRLVVCGGDTSGGVVRRVGIDTVEIVAQPWGNVALLRATFSVRPPIELVVKGGQMGERDLFAHLRSGAPT